MIPPKCLGIPVHYEPGFKNFSISLDAKRWWWPWKMIEVPGICETRGFFGNKRIVVSEIFLRFPSREKMAILLHEAGHVKLRHPEQRLWGAWKIILMPLAFARLCISQEYQADSFAAHCGYGSDLARALSRLQTDPKACLHPVASERCKRLTDTPTCGG
jgi:Zn-dependent protease with chaperone function